MPGLAAATDFSTCSDRAVRRAELLAAQTGPDVVLIHVIEEDQPDRPIRAASKALLRDYRRDVLIAPGA